MNPNKSYNATDADIFRRINKRKALREADMLLKARRVEAHQGYTMALPGFPEILVRPMASARIEELTGLYQSGGKQHLYHYGLVRPFMLMFTDGLMDARDEDVGHQWYGKFIAELDRDTDQLFHPMIILNLQPVVFEGCNLLEVFKHEVAHLIHALLCPNATRNPPGHPASFQLICNQVGGAEVDE